MHLIPGLPGEARRAGTGSVQRQKVCSQGLLVKHISLPARPFHHNGLAECHSSSGKTWDSAFQRIWSSAGCGFSDGNAGGSGGADGGQACAHWAPCFRPTDLEKQSALPEAPAAEKPMPRHVLYMLFRFKELVFLRTRARSGAGGPSITQQALGWESGWDPGAGR